MPRPSTDYDTLIQFGDRVYWEVVYPFSGKIRPPKYKFGKFVRIVKRRGRLRGLKPLAVVHFDGNKLPSLVPFNQLRKARL